MRQIRLSDIGLTVLIFIILTLTGCGVSSGGPPTATPVIIFPTTPQPPTATPVSTTAPGVAPPTTDPATGSTGTGSTTGGSIPTNPPNCALDSEYVADVTIPDGTTIAAGQTFVKTWRLKNTGTCAWSSAFQLVQTSGDFISAAGAVPLPDVQPGGEADISVSVTLAAGAPVSSEQIASFQMRDSAGNFFGGTPYLLVVVGFGESGGSSGLPTPTTITSTSGATISGTVWHDQCDPQTNAGCVTTDLGLRGNGLKDAGEGGINGVLVQLHKGGCPGSGTAELKTTASDGTYSFPNLGAGQFCVTVNSLDTVNSNILRPGSWTFPVTTDAVLVNQAVTLLENQALTGINFGWDFE